MTRADRDADGQPTDAPSPRSELRTPDPDPHKGQRWDPFFQEWVDVEWIDGYGPWIALAVVAILGILLFITGNDPGECLGCWGVW